MSSRTIIDYHAPFDRGFTVFHHCVVPEKSHVHPMKGHWKFLGGGGVLKVKFLETMYENKLEFPGGGGGGVQNKKTFHVGSMDTFWNCTFHTISGAGTG